MGINKNRTAFDLKNQLAIKKNDSIIWDYFAAIVTFFG